jgi:hypothetical protein
MSKVQGNFTVTVQPSTEPNPLVMTPQGGNLPGETQGVAIAGDPVCVVSGGTAPCVFVHPRGDRCRGRDGEHHRYGIAFPGTQGRGNFLVGSSPALLSFFLEVHFDAMGH